MSKPVEDRGHLAEATKPLKPKVYRPDRLPDPVQCAGCLIVVCDPADGSRLWTAQSDGSSWRRLKFDDEPAMPAAAASSVVVHQPQIDLTPLVREAVNAALPALVPQPTVKVIQAPQDTPEHVAEFAKAVLEMSEHVNRLAHENADLMARVEFLERNAIARVAAA